MSMSNPNHPHGHVIVQRRCPAWLLLVGLIALLLLACELPSLGSALAPATPPPGLSLGSTLTPAPTTPSPPAPTIAFPTKPTISPSPPRASVLPDDPRAAVIYALRAQSKAMPFRALVTIDTGGTQIKTKGEFESPRRVLVESSSGSVKMVDGVCYEKREGDIWRKCLNPQAGASAMAFGSSFLDEPAIDAVIKMIQTVKLVGTETLDGIPARVYEYTITGDQFGVHTDGSSRLWVSEAKGLPIKQVVTSKAGGRSTTATQTFQYDPAITVRAP